MLLLGSCLPHRSAWALPMTLVSTPMLTWPEKVGKGVGLRERWDDQNGTCLGTRRPRF